MTIIVRESKTLGTRYGVRVGTGSGRVWMGSYATREEAERIEREACLPKPRPCVDCKRTFNPPHHRRIRCSSCLKRSQKKARPKNDDHWLYLCHDNTGALLYVGITSSGIKRFRNHGDVTDWWKDVDHIIVKHFETRNEAEVCERLAIRDLEPKHNIQLIPREKPKGKPWPENVVPLPNASRRRPAS